MSTKFSLLFIGFPVWVCVFFHSNASAKNNLYTFSMLFSFFPKNSLWNINQKQLCLFLWSTTFCHLHQVYIQNIQKENIPNLMNTRIWLVFNQILLWNEQHARIVSVVYWFHTDEILIYTDIKQCCWQDK